MRCADHQRFRPVFVRQNDANPVTANANGSDLPHRLVAQRSRNIDGCKEFGIPNRLRTRGPGLDPIAGVSAFSVGRWNDKGGCERDGCSDREQGVKARSRRQFMPGRRTFTLLFRQNHWFWGVAKIYPFARGNPVFVCSEVHFFYFGVGPIEGVWTISNCGLLDKHLCPVKEKN